MSNKTNMPIIVTRIHKKSITALDFRPVNNHQFQHHNNTNNHLSGSSMSNFFNHHHHTSSSKLPNRPTIQFDSSSFNNYSSEANAIRSDLSDWSCMSWRKNVEKLFETVEFQHTKSYRAPTTNNASASRLFDQAAQSVDGNNSQTAGASSTANERKNSLSRAKASMAQQTPGGQSKDSSALMGSIGGKQSTNSTLNKSTANMQKRASIVSLKNTLAASSS